MRSHAYHPQQRPSLWQSSNQFVAGEVLPSLDPWGPQRAKPQPKERSPAVDPSAQVSLAQPEAHLAYRSCASLDEGSRRARGRLAARAFSHFLSSHEASHLSPSRRQSLQRLFGRLIGG